MENLKNLRMNELMDLLAFHTSAYTKILSDGGENQAFDYAKQMIDAIQKEIHIRKKDNSDKNDSIPQNFFGSHN